MSKSEFDFRELYEGLRWDEDERLWTPMTVLENGNHVYIGDIVDMIDYDSEIFRGKVINFCYLSVINNIVNTIIIIVLHYPIF